MPKNLTFGAAPEPDVVTIDGHTYHRRRITRSVQMKLAGVDKKMDEAREADASADKFVAIMVETIDTMLDPQGDSPPAKKLLMDAWKEDILSLDQVEDMLTQLSEAGAGPT